MQAAESFSLKPSACRPYRVELGSLREVSAEVIRICDGDRVGFVVPTHYANGGMDGVPGHQKN